MAYGKKPHIALMHYAGPPTIGGVESVMRHHADLLADAGYRVSIIAGRAEAWRPEVNVQCIDLIDSNHPDVLHLKQDLDTGIVPDEFNTLVARIEEILRSAFSDVDIVIAHNICTMAKNLALSQALKNICSQKHVSNGSTPAATKPQLIAWHHDLAWTAERYQTELHEGAPWSLLQTPWDDCDIQHVAVSQMRQQELASLLGLDPEQIKVVPSGVSLTDFYGLDSCAHALIADNQLEAHYPIFLLPVRITKRKNIEYAQEILAAIRERFPQAALIVTGPPGAHNKKNSGYFADLLAQRKALTLEPTPSSASAAVYFLAEMNDTRLEDRTIASMYRFADALLIPSAEEGFGIPLIEAGLSGMPIFCSNIAPFKEIAQDNALYFDIAQPATVTAALICDALEHSSTLRQRRRVRSEYSWSALFSSKIEPLLRNDNSNTNARPETGSAATSETALPIPDVSEERGESQKEVL